MRVHGVSLHYYNERANSDKFYRVMYWQNGNRWYFGKQWGRDGASGQFSLQEVDSQATARRLLDNKVREQIQKKSYQHLGEGYVDYPDNASVSVDVLGNLLHRKVGRPPLKLPGGMDYLIREEDDLDDLLREFACLSG